MTKACEWAARVEAWRASEQSAREYCTGRDYSANTLLWWSSRLRKGTGAPSRAAAEPVRLARVVRAPKQVGATDGAIVVQVGGARVEVPNGADRATLATVFEALGVGGAGAR